MIRTDHTPERTKAIRNSKAETARASLTEFKPLRDFEKKPGTLPSICHISEYQTVGFDELPTEKVKNLR
jgi:hypothetical protein